MRRAIPALLALLLLASPAVAGVEVHPPLGYIPGPLTVTGKTYARSISAVTPVTSVLTGTVITTASTTFTGTGTLFSTELIPGDKITKTGETRTVVTITSDTSGTVDTAFTATANDASVDRYPVSLSITSTDSSVANDIFVNPAVKSSGNLIWLGVANTSKFLVSGTQVVATVPIQGTTLKSSTTTGTAVEVGGVGLDANMAYLRLDTLAADTAGPPASGDCDASAEVGRTIVSTRYTATAEYRLWICTQTGAATYAWKYVGLL